MPLHLDTVFRGEGILSRGPAELLGLECHGGATDDVWWDSTPMGRDKLRCEGVKGVRFAWGVARDE